MAVKVLVNAIGQHIIADVKQVENTETKEILAYWVKEPRVASYVSAEEGGVNLRFSPYCLISDESEFSIRADNVVAILEPQAAVVESWSKAVYPEAPAVEAAETDLYASAPEEATPHPDREDEV